MMPGFRIHTDPTDRLSFDGRHYTVVNWTDDKVRLRRMDDGKEGLRAKDRHAIVETVTSDTMASIWARSDFRYERYYYSEYGGATGHSLPAPTVSTLNARDKAITLYRHAYVLGFLRLLAAKGPFKRTYESAGAAAKVLQPDIDALGHYLPTPDRVIALNKPTPRKVRVGKPMLVDGRPQVTAISPPSGDALMGWLWKFQKSGGDPMSLRPQYGKCGYFGSHLDPEVEGIITRHLPYFLTLKRPTPKQYLEKVETSIKARNEELKAVGETRQLQVPTVAAINKTIAGLDEYYVLCKRWGEDYARAAMPWVTEGLDIRVPGQRVEIDAYQVDVMVLMCWSGFWEGLTRNQRRLLKRKRMWLTVAIDRATRVIVGMRLSQSPDVPNAIAALEMVESDKTEYSRSAGTRSEWAQRWRHHDRRR